MAIARQEARFIRKSALGPFARTVGGEDLCKQILDALPLPVMVTDAQGKLDYFNAAAAAFLPHRPKLGDDKWIDTWSLRSSDGSRIPRHDNPILIVLKERHPIRINVFGEKHDGARVPLECHARPRFDKRGRIIGAVCILTESPISENEKAAHLLAIVRSTDDAIVSKDLTGQIVSWNCGAERLFGYTAEEAIGKSITMLIPQDRHDEEPEILSRIRRGESIDHYETVRQRKDGSMVDISLTVSPIKNENGEIVGASKIARDITEKRRAANYQDILLGEMKHRVRNLIAVIEGLGRQSLPANEPACAEFWQAFKGRIRALLSVGEIVLDSSSRKADFKTVAETTLRPFIDSCPPGRVSIEGPKLILSEQTSAGLALAMHELATNSVKYGALRSSSGSIALAWSLNREDDADHVRISWKEYAAEPIAMPRSGGFGTKVIEAAVAGETHGQTHFEFERDGLRCEFEFLRPE